MITPEVINDFTALQTQIWQTITAKVSEATEHTIEFSSPLTVAARTADLYAELASPMMAVQFSFNALPESMQAILLPAETVASLVHYVSGSAVEEIDDNTVSDLRPALEAIVQGMCLAAAEITSETVVAGGLTIRYQVFTAPANLQRSDEIARTQVAITAEGLSGTAIWLVDEDTVNLLLGLTEETADDGEAPFHQMAEDQNASQIQRTQNEDTSLERLLDVPLEITVELGRVKMLVKDVIELGTGSIVEIEKAAGEPVDVMVNGRLVARGEVVVIEDNFGVRVTEILNPQDRLNRLNEAA